MYNFIYTEHTATAAAAATTTTTAAQQQQQQLPNSRAEATTLNRCTLHVSICTHGLLNFVATPTFLLEPLQNGLQIYSNKTVFGFNRDILECLS